MDDETDEVDQQIAALPKGIRAKRVNPWVVLITETVDDGFGELFDSSVTLVLSDHGWVKAHWDRMHSQWQSRDHKRRGKSWRDRHTYIYTYGPTPESLVDLGIRTYPTLSAALGF